MNKAWRGAGVAAGIAIGIATVAGSTGISVRADEVSSAGSFPAYTELNSIACPTTTDCEAIGRSGVSQGQNAPFAEIWTKQRGWVEQAIPAPGGKQMFFSTQSISCSTPSACMVLGGSLNVTTGNFDAFAETWNGSSWAMTPAIPYNPGSSGGGLEAVSCFSSTMCMVVGGAVNAPAALSWNGSSWTTLSAPADFAGVTCPTAADCEAVGGYTNANTHAIIQAGGWNGKNWTLQTVPKLATEWSDIDEGSVSCVSVMTCEAVGYYSDTVGDSFTFAMAWNGKSWTKQTTPDPGGRKVTDHSISILSGVSCVSSSLCEATGQYENSSGSQDLDFASQWNGSTWSKKSMPTPSGAVDPFLQSVSCSSSALCIAVGSYLFYPTSSTVDVEPEAQMWNGRTWRLMTV
jgi:hypothetical protein